tara:strand:+ start:405 stop:710 length:306 start_codon:yes stop_codon:yes gene_type:complete
MSLELQIETLTAAINALNLNIAKLGNAPAAAEVVQEVAEEETVTAPVLTHKELQDLIMSMVREDMKRKPKIKALLTKYSASKVSDLYADNLEAFKAELVKL